MKTDTFIVKITHEDQLSISEIKEYIRVSIETWQGSYNPNGPVFDNFRNITVKRVLNEK